MLDLPDLDERRGGARLLQPGGDAVINGPFARQRSIRECDPRLTWKGPGASGEARDHHPRGVGKSEEAYRRPIGEPGVPTEALEHVGTMRVGPRDRPHRRLW
jgi:hypothetical protein